jgi:tetratricopeptide (TPR) repeat protein
MPFLGPYYYGKHKWDNYLLDIQETLESGNAAHRQNIRLQSGTLDVARKQVEELRQQTEQLSNIERALQNGFEGLRAEFEWGFTLMVDRMDTQVNLLSKVAEELDAIHQTLKSPLINQAQELFRLGEQHFNEGLWDKALKDFLESEKKNDVHPLLQLQIGKLYLFGRSDSYNLIDLPEAERHLLLAARYADAKKKTLTRWSGLCGQAYFYAGVAAYLIGEQEQAAGRPDSMRACLERALAYLAKAAILWPQFTEIIYTQAKCHALLGQIRDSTQKLEMLSDRDRRYFAKASQDGDFAIFSADVDEVFRRATISPGPFARAAQAKSDGVAEAIAWAKRSTPGAKVDLEAVEAFESELANARRSLTTLDVDIEALSARLSRMKAELEKIAQCSLQHNIDASKIDLSAQDALKNKLESSIGDLRKTMKSTKGTGAGCLVAFLACVLAIPVTKMLEHQFHEPLTSFFVLACFAIGFLVGFSISRSVKNGPLKVKVDENVHLLEECIQAFPALRQQVEYRKQEMLAFVTWQAQQPGAPPVPPRRS